MPRQCLFFPFIHFKVNSSSVTQNFLDEDDGQKTLCPPSISLFLSSQQSHFLTSSTLLFQLFFCLSWADWRSTAARGAGEATSSQTALRFSPKQSLNIGGALLQNLQLKINMRHWGPQYFHDIRENSDLTMGHPLLVAPLFVIAAVFGPLLCSVCLRPSFCFRFQHSSESGTDLGGMWCHGGPMTQMEHPHGHKIIPRERSKTQRCWDLLTKAPEF